MHVQWGTVLYQLILFIVLFMLLRKYALQPLVGMMEARHKKISDDIQTAENSRAEAIRLMEEQKEQLQAARLEAQKVIENSRVTADKQAEEIVKKAREEAEQFKKSAQTEIVREREQAVAALRAQVGTLSVLLATKIIEKELDAKQQDKLIQDFLKEVGEAK